MPEPRATADPDPDVERGKSKKQRKAVRGRSAGGTKSLVVWHQGRVHYADDSVFVLDLDDAACAELDVHDLVDRLTELREVLDSPGRSEAVSALVNLGYGRADAFAAVMAVAAKGEQPLGELIRLALRELSATAREMNP